MKKFVCMALELLLLLATALARQQEPFPEPYNPQRSIARTGFELLSALNSTQDSTRDQVVLLQGDIFLQPDDWARFQLPIHLYNQTVTLQCSPFCTLDWGGAVNLIALHGNMTWITDNMVQQGMAGTPAGYSAGLGYEIVGSVMWPTITSGEEHTKVFRNQRLVIPAGSSTSLCNPNITRINIGAMQRKLGRNDTITADLHGSYDVNQLYQSTFAIRDLRDGKSVGNIHNFVDNVTTDCSAVAIPGAAQAAPARASFPHASGQGIANSAPTLLHYLTEPGVSQITIAGNILLDEASLQAQQQLPIALPASTNLTLISNDESLRTLDFGRAAGLLMLEGGSNLQFVRVALQGLGFPSSALLTRPRAVTDSPLWPTVDGPPGHQVQFVSSAVEQVVTPCSRNSTRLQAELLKKVAGEQAVVVTGELSFTIAGGLVQRLPVRDIATGGIVGEAVYSFANTSMSCEEDPQISLASELASLQKTGRLSHPATSSNSTSASSGPSLGIFLGSVAAAVSGLAAAAAAATLFLRRRRRRRRPALRLEITPWTAGEAPGARTPLAVQGELAMKRSSSMELGETLQSDEKLPLGGDTPLVSPHDGNSSAAAKNTLWRSKFGAVEGLEIYDLLGKGAFGRVYRGRWNGAVVAVKVVEHQVVAGKQSDILREPLLSLAVSHPNCCTAYKLAIVRLLDDSHPKPALLVLDDHHDGAAQEGALSGSDAAPCSSTDSQGSGGKAAQAGQAAAAGSDTDAIAAPPLGQAPEPQGSIGGEGGSAGSAGSIGRVKPANSSRGGRPPRALQSLRRAGSPGPSPQVAAQGSGGSGSSGGSASASELARQGSRDRRRRLYAIVSGGAAVEVVSPSDVLSPGLFETWIISEYCDRGSLGEALAAGRLWLASTEEPDLAAVYLTLLDIAQGCDYLHNCLNILHGDLKPANVLLKGARNDRRGFTCKLADFGLSRLLSEAQSSIHTQTFGTPSYAPPEAMLQGRVSRAGDVYAFGIIMWECLSPPGEEPYPDLLVMQLVLAVAQGQRPRPLDSCHPPLQALMERCWAQDPEDRPGFAAVVRELRSQLQELRTRQRQGQQPQQGQQANGQHGGPVSDTASGTPTP